jgi:hypothetical protein
MFTNLEILFLSVIVLDVVISQKKQGNKNESHIYALCCNELLITHVKKRIYICDKRA